MMRIPVFVSCPTQLNPKQEAARQGILDHLDDLHLEARALGRSDYPDDYPLREVYVIARHCAGGIILGFEQCFAKSGTRKRGTSEERRFTEKNAMAFPSPWNHLEAGILFGLQLPLLIFREDTVSGGVFDPGVTDVFVQKMPPAKTTPKQHKALRAVFLKWHGKVSRQYYGD